LVLLAYFIPVNLIISKYGKLEIHNDIPYKDAPFLPDTDLINPAFYTDYDRCNPVTKIEGINSWIQQIKGMK
jgi:hypothetical protein